MLGITITRSELVIITTKSGEVIKFSISPKNKHREVSLAFCADKEVTIKRAKMGPQGLESDVDGSMTKGKRMIIVLADIRKMYLYWRGHDPETHDEREFRGEIFKKYITEEVKDDNPKRTNN